MFIVYLIFFVFSINVFSQEILFIKENKGYIHLEKKTFYKKEKRKKHKIHRKRKERYYIASKRGKRFHRPDCRFAKRIKKRVIFKNRNEALERGLKPCSVCKP